MVSLSRYLLFVVAIMIFIIQIVLLFFIHFSHSQECGKINARLSLIVGGNKAIRGEFPFLVALFEYLKEDFLCGGTLVTNKHAITGKLMYYISIKKF